MIKPNDLLKDERVIAEIEKHKWFESEKAGYDIGFETAAADWIKKYGDEWIKYNYPKQNSVFSSNSGVQAKARRLGRSR